jgi:hypothetical protein
MAARPPSPLRPVPPLPVDNEDIRSRVSQVKQAQDNVVAAITATNDAKGTTTVNIGPNTTQDDVKAMAANAKASLGLPSSQKPALG